jgi:hypothetical protein
MLCFIRQKVHCFSFVMSLPILKRDAPTDLLAQMKQIEERCNKWAGNLALLGWPRDVASWGTLTQIIELIEQHVARYGQASREHRDAMIRLGPAGAWLLNRIRSSYRATKESWLRWTDELRTASNDAVLTEERAETFVYCFTTWHQNRRAVELLSPSTLRFSVPESQLDRRIHAYQQGRRIPAWPPTPDNPVGTSLVNDADVNRLLSKLCDKVTVEGALAIRYPNDSELLSHLRDINDKSLRRDFRRKLGLDLGGYDLNTYRRLFAVLVSICSVHEYVCDYWAKKCGRYPIESAVMVKLLTDWVTVIASLSDLDGEQVRLMLADLTMGMIRPIDLHIQPFVCSVDAKSLFLIPHFVPSSRPEENILRVCALARERCYKPIANEKEEEMRDSIMTKCPDRYRVFGPLMLPAPTPDIDMIIKDAKARTLLIGELKWLRKPTRVIDQPDKDAELDEGFRQLKEIRAFLAQHPTYLRERGIIEPSESDPNLSFALIARDHLSDTGHRNDLWITEFDALIWALNESADLTDCIRRLQALEWLPVEGRDFAVRFQSCGLAGVTIESEFFHHVGG